MRAAFAWRRLLWPSVLKRGAAYAAITSFLFIGLFGGTLVATGWIRASRLVLIAVLVPVFPFLVALARERFASSVSPLEARELIGRYGTLLEDLRPGRRPESDLPATKKRLKEAFRVMVPIAIKARNTEYLTALQAGYGLLSTFGPQDDSELGESLQLSVEFKALLGVPASVRDEADNLRAEIRNLATPQLPEVAEQTFRAVAAAELKARRRQADS